MHHTNTRFSFWLFLSILVFAFPSLAQVSSESELKKEGEKYFEAADYEKALPDYSRLLSLYPNNSVYMYRFGVCQIMAGKDKASAFTYLEKASLEQGVPDEVWFYLGKSYLVTNEFRKAKDSFTKYKSIAGSSKAKKYDVDTYILNAGNGEQLIKSRKNVAIMKSFDVAKNNFYSSYDFSNSPGKIVNASEDFYSQLDRAKQKDAVMFMSNDKHTILISSYGVKGENGKDIYIVRKLANGTWSKAQNLGVVNSTKDEDYPFLDRDGKTLYFSSCGHNSMGGYDVFKSVFDFNTSEWSAPENMGVPINSVYDDILFVPQDNKNAIYASDVEAAINSISIRSIELPNGLSEMLTIAGEYIPLDQGVRRDARITALTSDGRGIITSVHTDPVTGKYDLMLAPGQTYMLVVEGGGYLPHAESFELPAGMIDPTLKQVVKLNKDPQKEEMTLENYFTSGGATTEPTRIHRTYVANKDESSMMTIMINDEPVRVPAPTPVAEKNATAEGLADEEYVANKPTQASKTEVHSNEQTISNENSSSLTNENSKVNESGSVAASQAVSEDKSSIDNTNITSTQSEVTKESAELTPEIVASNETTSVENDKAEPSFSKDITNEELAKIAFADAKEIQMEADSLKQESVAMKKAATDLDTYAEQIKATATGEEDSTVNAQVFIMHNQADQFRSQAAGLDQIVEQKETEANEALANANQMLAASGGKKSKNSNINREKVKEAPKQNTVVSGNNQLTETTPNVTEPVKESVVKNTDAIVAANSNTKEVATGESLSDVTVSAEEATSTSNPVQQLAENISNVNQQGPSNSEPATGLLKESAIVSEQGSDNSAGSSVSENKANTDSISTTNSIATPNSIATTNSVETPNSIAAPNSLATPNSNDVAVETTNQNTPSNLTASEVSPENTALNTPAVEQSVNREATPEISSNENHPAASNVTAADSITNVNQNAPLAEENPVTENSLPVSEPAVTPNENNATNLAQNNAGPLLQAAENSDSDQSSLTNPEKQTDVAANSTVDKAVVGSIENATTASQNSSAENIQSNQSTSNEVAKVEEPVGNTNLQNVFKAENTSTNNTEKETNTNSNTTQSAETNLAAANNTDATAKENQPKHDSLHEPGENPKQNPAPTFNPDDFPGYTQITVQEEAKTAYRGAQAKLEESNELSNKSLRMQEEISHLKSSTERDQLINESNDVTQKSIQVWQEGLSLMEEARKLEPNIDYKMSVLDFAATSDKTVADVKTQTDSSPIFEPVDTTRMLAMNTPSRKTNLSETSTEQKPQKDTTTEQLDTTHPDYPQYAKLQKDITDKQIETIDIFADAINLSRKASDETDESNRLLDEAQSETDTARKSQLLRSSAELKALAEAHESEAKSKFGVAKNHTKDVKTLVAQMKEVKERITLKQGENLASINSSNAIIAGKKNKLSEGEGVTVIEEPQNKKMDAQTFAMYERANSELNATDEEIAAVNITNEQRTNFLNTCFNRVDGTAYSDANPIPIDPSLPEGLVFKIQVGGIL